MREVVPAETRGNFIKDYTNLEATSMALLAKEAPLGKRAAQLAKRDADVRRSARDFLGAKQETYGYQEVPTKAQEAVKAAESRRKALLILQKDAERHKVHWEGR